MTRFMMSLAAAVVGAGTAFAGGPPPVYVVVEAVNVLPAQGTTPERVMIRGAYVRQEAGGKYSAPTEGFVTLSLDEQKAAECRAEWKKLREAAGTGRAVAVGMCGEGGAMLTTTLHRLPDISRAADAVYTPGHLGKTDKQEWADQPPVKALLAFVKERDARTVKRK